MDDAGRNSRGTNSDAVLILSKLVCMAGATWSSVERNVS